MNIIVGRAPAGGSVIAARDPVAGSWLMTIVDRDRTVIRQWRVGKVEEAVLALEDCDTIMQYSEGLTEVLRRCSATPAEGPEIPADLLETYNLAYPVGSAAWIENLPRLRIIAMENRNADTDRN